jgi:hypothetical protein
VEEKEALKVNTKQKSMMNREGRRKKYKNYRSKEEETE